MKYFFFLFFVAILAACIQNQKQGLSDMFEIKRGTNIAHWLSQSERRGVEREQFFTKSDIEEIVKMGFDHIRLPLDEEQMWDENGRRHDDAFQLLENCMNWCAKNNIRAVVDLHILRSHHFNAIEKPLWTDPNEQEKFFDLWRDLSKTLKKYPNNLVAYELMNEAVADDHEEWNNLMASAFAAVRELEPERTIVVGSNKWQQVGTFDALKVPAADPNIILSFHFYNPMLLTHYQAHWTQFKDFQCVVKYPGEILSSQEFETLPDSLKIIAKEEVGTIYNKASLFETWEQPLRKAKELGLPLYCGEFGVLINAPEEDRLNWYRDIIALFEENNVAYANWNYNSDEFGLIDNDLRHEQLISIVTGK